MKHPLDGIPESTRKPLFLALFAWTLVLLAVFQLLNAPLITSAAPSGIISLQLAWTPEKARAMLASWDARAGLIASLGLGFDYLFMPSYALMLALAALLASGRHPGWFSHPGTWVGYGAFLAAICDGLENFGQIRQLLNGETGLVTFVGVCATIKFSLLFLAIAYGLIGWGWPKTKDIPE